MHIFSNKTFETHRKLQFFFTVGLFLISIIYPIMLILFIGFIYIILSDKNYQQICVNENEIEFIYSELFSKYLSKMVSLSNLCCIEDTRYQKIGNVYLVYSFLSEDRLIAEIDEEFFKVIDMINLKEYLSNVGVNFIVK